MSQKYFFLRKLFLRKNLVLHKKNHAPNFFFYRLMINSFLNIKYYNFYNFYNLKNFNHILIFPDFFHKKQVLNNTIFFKRIVNEKNLNYFFYNEKESNNYLIFNKNNENVYNFLKEEMKHEDKKLPVFNLKKVYYGINHNEFNFSTYLSTFFNFNIYINCNEEIYKIIIFLYINKLK